LKVTRVDIRAQEQRR